jgi:DNA polymerase-3 subunit beta
MPNGDLEINIEDGKAILKCGKSKCKISVIDGDNFPDFPKFDIESKFSIDYSELKSMINQTIFATSIVETKPILTGELFDIQNGLFNIVAIDGYRLAIRSCNTNCATDYKFVVPSKSLREIASISNDCDEQCEVFVSSKHAIFKIGSIQVYTRLIEGEFPNYKQSLSGKTSTTANIKVSELTGILNRCQIILDERNKCPITCNFSNGELSIKCKTELGAIEDSMTIDMCGNNLRIGFNNKYLLDALKSCECDIAKIEMSSPISAITILPPKDVSFSFIVLPVRLKDEI